MPSAIARFIPFPRLREVDRIAVAAAPDVAWTAVRNLDLYELGWVRTLFRLRGAKARTATFDEIVAPGSGFHLLADEGHKFVAGAVGKFWRPTIPFADIASDAFAAFGEPGFGKVAWSVAVHPRIGGGSWIVVDLRVDATSDEAWDSFTPYWIAIGRFSRANVGFL